MKKTRKKILGVSGLVLVIAVTVVAAMLPGPGASATDEVTSVTDTIQVRVVGSVPRVDITGIDNNEIIVTPNQTFTVDYENVETMRVTLTHTALDGTVTEYELDSFVPDYYPGSEYYEVNFIKSTS